MGKEIGIDLGTTNTVVSYMNRYNNIRTMNLKSNKNRAIIPSVLYFKSRNDVFIGVSAKSKGTVRPRACVKNFKSKLGNMKFKYTVTAENGEKFSITASKAVSIFLKKVIEDAQNVISDEFYDTPELASIDKVVISVPAKFEENQISDLKRAAKEASLNNVELIPEPTAAAIAYINEHDIKNNENILVYDFGGGTFDIAILERNGNSFSSPQTDGDVQLGGNDITRRIIEDVIRHINDDFKMNMPSKPEDYDEEYCNVDKDIFYRNYNEIFRACNDDIKHLYGNNGDEFTGDIKIIKCRKEDGSYISRRFDYYYNIGDIENIIREDIGNTVERTKNAILRAYERNVSIEKVILAGGSSQLPLVKKMLDRMIPEIKNELKESFSDDSDIAMTESQINKIINKRLGRLEVVTDDDLSALISIGDAYKASQSFSFNFVPTTTSAIGIKVQKGNLKDVFETIIPEGVNIPCKYSKEFDIIMVKDNKMEIKIFECDEKIKKNDLIRTASKSVRKRYTLTVKDIPNEVNMKLIVTFSVQKDKTIIINADIKSGDRVISANHKIERDVEFL